MIGVDTNVLVRILLSDDEQQTQAAQRLVTEACAQSGLYLSAFAILELAWVLKSKQYSKQQIADSIDRLIHAVGVTVTHRTTIEEALELFRQAPASVGFADCLIIADTARVGAPLFTFDEPLRRFDGRCRSP